MVEPVVDEVVAIGKVDKWEPMGIGEGDEVESLLVDMGFTDCHSFGSLISKSPLRDTLGRRFRSVLMVFFQHSSPSERLGEATNTFDARGSQLLI